MSLLQGGTAPIVPVQGGGGSSLPTPDYNPSASLLQGGTGVIEPIRGGGKAKEFRFATDLEETREFSGTAAPANVSRASRAYTLEVYGLPVDAVTLALDTDLSVRQRRLMSYVNAEKRTRLVTSMGAYEAGEVYTSYPKYGDCKPTLPENFFTDRARKVHFMDDRAHTIWLIPNVKGNKELYETIYNKLVDNYSLPGKDHVLIFTGPFYPDTPNDVSVFLFDEILKLKQKNPGQVFVISPSNATLLRNGCHILEQTYAMKTTLAKAEGKSKDVPTFFEPDVLVFPHEKFVVRSSDMPIAAEQRVSVGLLAKKKVFTKSYYIQPKLAIKSDPSPLEQYVTVLSSDRLPETLTWPPKSQQTIKCPKNSDCDHFQVGFPLSVLGESIVFNFLQAKLYLFHITKEKIPYLTGPKEEGEEEEEEEEEEVDVVPVEEEEEEEVEVIPAKPIKISAPKKITGFYKESANAKPSNTVTFDLGEYTFTVRVPKSHTSSDPIRLDWLNETFTKDEALLLNALQLTPTLMKQAFGEMYKWKLSSFLASLTYSSCFKETSLLLSSECEDSRRFLRKVSYLMEKDCLEKFYTNLGAPPKGDVEVTPSNDKPSNDKAPRSLTSGSNDFAAFLAGLRNLSLGDESPMPREELPSSLTAASGLELLSDILTATGADGKELRIGDYVNCGEENDLGFIYGFLNIDGQIYAVPISDGKPVIEKQTLASKCKKTRTVPPTASGIGILTDKAYGESYRRKRASIAALNAIGESWRNLSLEPFPELEPVPELRAVTRGLNAMKLEEEPLAPHLYPWVNLLTNVGNMTLEPNVKDLATEFRAKKTDGERAEYLQGLKRSDLSRLIEFVRKDLGKDLGRIIAFQMWDMAHEY